MDQVEWLRRHGFQSNRPLGNAPAWEPMVDIFESEEAFFFLIALPGVDPAEIQIALAGRNLIISGESSRPATCREAVVRRLEIPSGRFERSLELPPGRFEIGPREYSRGCLLFKLVKLA
jgi:HSP20 family molecular chaperone IbpA